ncbi:leucine-rich repeat protein [Dokdonia ponticola]|uniref:Leucine-rich repeat protein n=1 Tax=Dokdonia ponticola TaxID=2041041 RepID=A0ABV9HXP2_9FLAO
MKTKIVIILCILFSISRSFAQTFTVDGLNYTIVSTTPNEVQLTGGTPPTSDLVIPNIVNDGIDDFTVVALGNNAFESKSITSISFPTTIRSIGDFTFDQNSLTTIELPEGLETIGQRAFRFNSIANITFPSTMVSIGESAFGANPLAIITAEGTTPATIGTTTFGGSRSNIDLTVPDGTEDTYLTAGWTGFNSINGVQQPIIGGLFEVDGLSYVITALVPNEVRLTGGTPPTSDLVIPETVSDNGTDFTVVALGNSAFEGKGITSVSLPSTLRDLGEATFRINGIAEVVIPDGITDIPQRCFSNNDLISVSLPISVETIGFRSFENNDLTSLVLPENVTSIAQFAFTNSPLTSVNSLNPTPPSVVTGAGNNDSFTNESNIDLTVPDGTEAAYETAGWVGFNSVNGVVNFEVGDTFIENNLNYTVTSLAPNEVSVTGGNSVPQNLTIPENVSSGGSDFVVTAVGSSAFISNGLTSVSLPNTITTIGGQAFRNNQLTSITFPETVSSIAFRAFQGNPLVAVIALGSTPANITTDVTTDSFSNRGSIDLTIPIGTQLAYLNSGWTGFATINGELSLEVGNTLEVGGFSYTVTALDPTEVEAAGGTTIPTNLIIPEAVLIQDVSFTVVGIGDGAFESSGLTSVTFPTTIRAIGTAAFRFNALESVVIPEGVTDLPNRCFSNNDLTSVTFPSSLETLGFRSFENNDLTTLILPENVVSIGQLAFNNSTLNSINSLNPTPPSVVLGTGDDSFDNENDIDLTVPEGTEAAYEAAGWVNFNSLNGVINFEVGDVFTENNLNYTVSSVAPNEVTITGGIAVPQDLVVDAMVSSGDSDFTITAIGGSAFDASDLTSVILPNTIVSIGASSFRNNQLTSVILPNNLVSIGGQGFRNNELTSITFPETISSISFRAFEGNPLSEVIALGNVPASITTGNNDTFSNRPNIDLAIPTGTTQAYEDGGWINFNSITEIDVAITVAPKVFLQGASLNPITGEENLMRDDLRVNNLLPTLSPYGDGATVDPTVFTTTGANAIVDWVFVELRQGTDNENTSVVASTSALLQRDGDIVGLDGTSFVTFIEEEGDYFIAIKHRNHIGILAAVPAPLSSTVSTIDFTQDAAFAKGENLALTQVNGTFAMIAGDADGSSQILNTDITEALTLAGGSEAYSTADADMNGFVLNSDIQLLVLANSGTVQQFE